jgi:hypothetical protein
LFVNVIRKNYRDNFKEATYKWATKESPPLERRIEKHRNNKNRGILEQRIEKHRNSKTQRNIIGLHVENRGLKTTENFE